MSIRACSSECFCFDAFCVKARTPSRRSLWMCVGLLRRWMSSKISWIDNDSSRARQAKWACESRSLASTDYRLKPDSESADEVQVKHKQFVWALDWFVGTNSLAIKLDFACLRLIALVSSSSLSPFSTRQKKAAAWPSVTVTSQWGRNFLIHNFCLCTDFMSVITSGQATATEKKLNEKKNLKTSNYIH